MLITGKLQIKACQIIAQRGAVRLESLGMRHSGGNITPKLKKHYGMKRNATHADVIAKLNEELASIEAELGITR